MAAIEPWYIKGELMLSCNCTVFCPCVVSLGQHPPTEGYCQTWGGVRIDHGKYGDIDLSELNMGLIMEIPGRMSRGKWTAGLLHQRKGRYLSGQGADQDHERQGARGRRILLSILVAQFLGVHQKPITYENDGEVAPVQDPQDHRRRDRTDHRQQGWRSDDDRKLAILDCAANHRCTGEPQQVSRFRTQLGFPGPQRRDLSARLEGALRHPIGTRYSGKVCVIDGRCEKPS